MSLRLCLLDCITETLNFRPIVQPYVISCNCGIRRIMAGVCIGCLSLAVEIVRYTSIPFRQRLCRVCSGGTVEDQTHFLLYCTKLNSTRSDLFAYSNQINCKFTSKSQSKKLFS